MSDQVMFTIVVGYRDRGQQRIRRFLDSLGQQTMQSFRLLFIDYGSTPADATEVHSLVTPYPFAHYVYAETRGYPWNRSHALNIGGRLTQTDYLVTTDIDMLFLPDFFEKLAEVARPDRVIYCSPDMLPEGFSDWGKLEEYSGQFRLPGKPFGLFNCIATRVFQSIRGFDEYYRYWGLEDNDLYERLMQVGLEEYWLTEQGRFFHQWHPTANIVNQNAIPSGVWVNMFTHYLRSQQIVERNGDTWGCLTTADQRPVFQFLDFDRNTLRQSSSLAVFDRAPDTSRSIVLMMNQLTALPAGHALAVKYALHPRRYRFSEFLVQQVNRVFHRFDPVLTLDYSYNAVHHVIGMLAQEGDLTSDYYLQFPALDGVSVLVRS